MSKPADPNAPTDPPALAVTSTNLETFTVKATEDVEPPGHVVQKLPARPNPFAPPRAMREMGPSRPPEPEAPPVAPDLELKRLGEVARATCGCHACTGRVKPTRGGHTRSRVEGSPVSCIAAAVFTELARRAEAGRS